MTTVEKYAIWSSTAVATVTGVTYAWMKYWLKPADPYAVINHPLQPFVLKLHIASVPFLVFAIGMVTLQHIVKYYRTGVQRARSSGLGSMWLVLPMIVSGYAIQMLADSAWLRAVGYAHFGVGIAFAVFALIHALKTR